jgi:hypothetical protein
LNEIQTKVLKVFRLAILFTCIALPLDFYFFKLTQPLTVSTFQLLYTIKEKGGKPILFSIEAVTSLWFKKSIQKPNSQGYPEKPQRNGIFMNSASDQSTASGLAPSCNRVERQQNVVVNSWILAYLRSNPKSLTGG